MSNFFKINTYLRLIHSRLICIIAIVVIFLSCSDDSEERITSMGFSGGHYLEVRNSTTLKSLVSSDFTIEIWAAGDTSQAVVSRSLVMFGNNDGGNEIAIYQGPGDSSLVTVYIDDQWFGFFNIDGLDWSKEKCHYLCLTRADNFFTFYFDGKLLKTEALNSVDLDIGSSNMLIGADYDPPDVNNNPGNYWEGTIDEVRIWTKVIQSAEVSFHHKNPDKLTEHYSSAGLDHLIGIWRFNEEFEDFVPDESGNANHAYFQGDPGSIYWDTGK
ncbi:MAG: LamG domain-containing protein [Candidatus Marinimicrobia bacterium]|nr:LamG domain-containing protein [Candidatus Neomarinimicrobiota bacterium]MBL7066830.1 LamG domain-containing protein [Candidatus Neomarinimicrobiota bacterium]